MPIQETSLENRAFGTLAFEYDKQTLRFEDASRALQRLARDHRNISHYVSERDEALASAVAIRAILIQKLREHDARLGLKSA